MPDLESFETLAGFFAGGEDETGGEESATPASFFFHRDIDIGETPNLTAAAAPVLADAN